MRQLTITQSNTNRDSSAMVMYLSEISRYELISVEKEIELAQRIRKGDRQAIEELTKANLRFVVSVAKQYQNQGLILPDLINEGNIGLIKAAEKYDETKGFKFISYAVWWIRQTIQEAINQQARIVRLPLNQLGTISKVNKISQRFEQLNNRLPRIDEIEEMTDINQVNIRISMRVAPKHISFDVPFQDDEEHCLYDITEDIDAPHADNNMMGKSLSEALLIAMNCLDQREQYIISHLYGINANEKTPGEIGQHLGITRERVRQITNLAIRKLKKNKDLKKLMN